MNDELPDDFDPDIYLSINPDVAAAGIDAGDHYRRFGRSEGRAYRADRDPEDDLPDGFDPDVYLDINPDVAAAGQDPTNHYRTSGKREGRAYYRSTPVFTSEPVECASSSETGEEDAALPSSKSPKVIAFYLPQFHRVAENDLWWGEGFTEWTNVKKAKPNLVGHIQPHIPLNADYYDLENIEVHAHQASLAKQYGVHAFCYYMYWFNGRRVLEKPLDMRLTDKTIDHPFCICWANENWTRRWDGREEDILLRQVHSLESDREFIKDAIKYLSDSRYLRIDGKLVLLVYRVDLIPNCPQTAEVWREEVRRAGLGELHLCAVQAFDIDDPRPFGFDAAIEFPPHGWFKERNLPAIPHRILNPRFRGHVFDYRRAVDFGLQRSYPDYRWYRGAFPSWDNTPRRQDAAHLFLGHSAPEFQRWLTGLLQQQIARCDPEHQLVFVNAWNEWGEGAHLEPDEELGLGNLEAVAAALEQVQRTT